MKLRGSQAFSTFISALLFTTVTSFYIEENYSNCLSLDTTVYASDDDLNSTAGYVAQLSYSSNFNDPILYNRTVFWSQYTKLDSMTEMNDMKLYRISENEFRINASLIPFVNASWYPRIGPGAYSVQSSLFVYLFTSTDANSSTPHASAPVMQTNGTSNRIAYRTSTGADLKCDSYLHPNGTLSGYPFTQVNSTKGRANYALQAGLGALCVIVALLFIIFIFLFLRRRNVASIQAKMDKDTASLDYESRPPRYSQDSLESDIKH